MILESQPSDAHDWVLIAAPDCVLAIPAAEAARFDGVAARLSGPDGFRAALELLIAGGITDAPPFALVDGNSSVARVVLRGEARIAVAASDPDVAELTISGVGVATWSERVLEGARSLRLEVPGSTWTLTLAPSRAASDELVEGEPVEPGELVELVELVAPSEPAAVTAESEVVAPVAPTAPVAEATLVPRAEIEAPAAAVAAEVEPYDFLFGDTIYRTQSGASIRIPNPDPERPGDHDGRTMLAEDLGLAGHVSEVPVFPELPKAAAPALQLERADGSRESLDRPVVIGRAPSAPSAAASGPTPRLITILDDKDISRSHLRIAVEGDAVVVTDLASRNGTVVTMPGGPPRKLRAAEPTVVLPGTLIDLGGGVTFTVRED